MHAGDRCEGSTSKLDGMKFRVFAAELTSVEYHLNPACDFVAIGTLASRKIYAGYQDGSGHGERYVSLRPFHGGTSSGKGRTSYVSYRAALR